MSKLLEILESIEPIKEVTEDESASVEEADATNVAKLRPVVKRITIATLAVAFLLLLINAGAIYSAASKFIKTAVSPPEAPRTEERVNTASLKADDRMAPLDFRITPGISGLLQDRSTLR